MADRFYTPDAPVDGLVTLRGDEARHLARVLRLGPGAVVEVFDGRGGAWTSTVTEVGKDYAALRVTGPPLPDRVAEVPIQLACAVPKGERFDWLVEKATELGVVRLIPLTTRRSVVDPRAAKVERVRRAVVEASKQCGRSRLMEVDDPTPFPTLLNRAAAGVKLLAHPRGHGVRDWPRRTPGEACLLAVGPEGGFTDEEVAQANEAGFVGVGLGPTILRIETAALAGVSRVLAWAEFGAGRERADT